MFKFAVGTEKGHARPKQRKHNTHDRFMISRELDLNIIKIAIKYAEGKRKRCNRLGCEGRLTLSEVLRHLKACVIHRIAAKVRSKEHRTKLKEGLTGRTVKRRGKKVCEPVDMQVHTFAHAYSPQKAPKTEIVVPSSSNRSYVYVAASKVRVQLFVHTLNF